MKNRKFIFSSLLLLLLVLLTALKDTQAQGRASRIGNSPYPVSSRPDTLFMVGFSHLSPSQQFTAVSLQGLLAKTKPVILTEMGAAAFRADLPLHYGITLDSTYYNNFAGLIQHFRNQVNGYILCNWQDSTTDAAISVCAMMNAFAVAPQDTALMDSLGLPQVYSTIGKGEVWSYDSFRNNYSKKIVAIQDPAKCTFLSDYMIFSGGMDYWDLPLSDQSSQILSGMDINGALMGWSLEFMLTSAASQHSLHVHASDFSANLSAYSNLDAPCRQVNHSADTLLRPGVHTVCFLMTDGDNIQWLGNDFISSSNWFGCPRRGEVNLGWTISPALAELGPTQMKHIYDSAATTPSGRDGFVSGPSGIGYFYPDLCANPDSVAAITGRMMQKADLSIMNVIAQGYNRASLKPFLDQPNIDAILFYEYSNYSGLNGFSDCIDGKPVISGRFNLNTGDNVAWTLAQKLDTMPKNPYSPDGYSLVPVNVWADNVDSVIACMRLLDSTVRVVTPESFVKLFMAGNNCIAQPDGMEADHSKPLLLCNRPNPCSVQTEIVYELPEDAAIEIVLFDPLGREIKQLLMGYETAGIHQFAADLKDIPAGIYTYRLSAAGYSLARKCSVLR